MVGKPGAGPPRSLPPQEGPPAGPEGRAMRIGLDQYTIGHRALRPRTPWSSPGRTASTACNSSSPPRSTGISTPGPWPRSAAGPRRWACTWRSACPHRTRSGARAGRAGRSTRPRTRATSAGTSRPSPRWAAGTPGPMSATGTTGSAPTSPGTPSSSPPGTCCGVWAVLTQYGRPIALETHADLTADELVELLDALGPDRAGVTLDTGNLVMRLDDPVPDGRAAGAVGPGDPRQGHGAGLHPARALLAGPARSAPGSCPSASCSPPCGGPTRP
jgi:hypothetical protein